jgi:hypothetical protein
VRRAANQRKLVMYASVYGITTVNVIHSTNGLMQHSTENEDSWIFAQKYLLGY